MWNIPVTAADTRVGDADVSGRSEGGVTTPPPPPIWGYPPFLVRRVVIRSGIARGKSVGTVLGGFREDGSGDSQRDGGFCTGSPAGAEELAGAEEIAIVEDIAGAVAIASVGISIYTIIIL